MFYTLVEVVKDGRIAQRNGYILYEVVSSRLQRGQECPKVGTRLTVPELEAAYPGVVRYFELHRYADFRTGEICTS
jgi:hypothetical protein